MLKFDSKDFNKFILTVFQTRQIITQDICTSRQTSTESYLLNLGWMYV